VEPEGFPEKSLGTVAPRGIADLSGNRDPDPVVTAFVGRRDQKEKRSIEAGALPKDTAVLGSRREPLAGTQPGVPGAVHPRA
jgi:hypothetical protein